MKVTITAEQAKAIEERKVKYNETDQDLIDYQYFMKSEANEGDDSYADNHECLNDISPFYMAKALLTGYEIEQPKPKEGDWIVRLDGEEFSTGKKFAQIEKLHDQRNVASDFNDFRIVDGLSLCFNGVTHATNEEAFWAELGREVGEFREGDVRLINDYSSVYTTATIVAKNEYNNGELAGFYPAESFITFPTGDSNDQSN